MSEDAEKVLDVKKDFGGRYADVEVWDVPRSDRYPEGIKYSMQFGTTLGRTIIRYDNFPDHPDADRHHRHTADGDVEDVEFEGIWSLFSQFKEEVRAHGHEW